MTKKTGKRLESTKGLSNTSPLNPILVSSLNTTFISTSSLLSSSSSSSSLPSSSSFTSASASQLKSNKRKQQYPTKSFPKGLVDTAPGIIFKLPHVVESGPQSTFYKGTLVRIITPVYEKDENSKNDVLIQVDEEQIQLKAQVNQRPQRKSTLANYT